MNDRNNGSGFRRRGPQVDLPAMDARVLELWDQADAFQRSVTMRPAEAEYTFYDGPPFPTGSPHYGNLLAGVIKDIVPRYWTMRGRRVVRRFGWDTHGLPIEMEVQQQLDISGPKAIRDFGVGKFNEACRTRVQTNTENWEHITRKLGRWVDFRDNYRTMDVDFMETVWWVFRQLWDKGYIYRDFKVLPYSWGATTPLSNFELNLGGYRDVEDPSLTLRLRVVRGAGPAEEGDWILIWTTTPWTLPANLAVAVGEEIDYSRVSDEGDHYWIATELISTVFGEDAQVVATAAGTELLGTAYDPPFDYFGGERDRGAFVVIPSDDVTTEEGTGLVHMAPAYGEADFYSLQDAGLDVLVDPVDLEARFTDEVPDVAGMYVKDADPLLVDMLRDKGLIVHLGKIIHPYPFCYRTNTPLIYKAIPTWFVAVESFKDRMVAHNEKIHWVPEYVGRRRFGNWLEEARDWAISRNRYWGSCIPVWECDSCDELVCVGSRQELFDLTGVMVEDLHKHFVDEVTFACGSCGGTMRRVPEVLDCWFESGSMPYAQLHYPFENESRFRASFPADFIAEGLDQTRGWFYTLHVLATALFDRPAFQNCVVNGMILAEDGLKMSKSLKNYPDPNEILDEFGADALRAYMINSPVLRAEPLRFSRDGVRSVVRMVLLPFWNAFSFFTTYAEADGITAADLAAAPPIEHRAEIDRWIVSVLQSLIRNVNEEMEQYRLYAVIPPILDFIDDLTNWYIRRSRRRFWAHREPGADADKLAAFATLYDVLVTFSMVAAPVLPFITEEVYQQLVRSIDPDAPDSVHHTDYPRADTAFIEDSLESDMAVVRLVVNMGRGLRKQHELRVRQPLNELTVVTHDPAAAASVAAHSALISQELNVKSVAVDSEESHLVRLSAKANFKVLGPRLGSATKEVAAAIAAWDDATVAGVVAGATVEVAGNAITLQDVVVERTPREGVVVAADREVTVALDTSLDDELIAEGLARELINRIQGMRRELGLAVTDRITVEWDSADATVADAVGQYRSLVADEVLAPDLVRSPGLHGRRHDLNGRQVTVSVAKA